MKGVEWEGSRCIYPVHRFQQPGHSPSKVLSVFKQDE
jgi:hypothetical protein